MEKIEFEGDLYFDENRRLIIIENGKAVLLDETLCRGAFIGFEVKITVELLANRG